MREDTVSFGESVSGSCEGISVFFGLTWRQIVVLSLRSISGKERVFCGRVSGVNCHLLFFAGRPAVAPLRYRLAPTGTATVQHFFLAMKIMTVGLFVLAARLFHTFQPATPQPQTQQVTNQQDMFPSGYVNWLGATEEQGGHTETAAVNVGTGNMERLPGGGMTEPHERPASSPIESLQRAFLECLVARTLVRWHEFRQRAAVRAQELADYLKRLEGMSTEFAPHLSSRIVEDFIGTMRLQQILDWMVKHPALDFWGECPQSATQFDMDSPPHYLTVCSVEDLEASAKEAYIVTGYEEQHGNGNELAEFCFINRMLDIERILTMSPREVKEADTDLFFKTDSHSRKNCEHSTLFVRSMTVVHPGDARAVLVFSDGDTVEVTDGSHGPCCARCVNLSGFANGEDRGKFGWDGVGTENCKAKKAPLALVLGRGEFFDVWTDHEVAQACTESLYWLQEHRPGTALADARRVVARLLTKEATVRGGSTENTRAGVDLLDSLGFPDSSPPLPPREPDTRPPPPPPPVASRQRYRQPASEMKYSFFQPQGEAHERRGDGGRGHGLAGCRRRGGMCGWGGFFAGSIQETLQSVFASCI